MRIRYILSATTFAASAVLAISMIVGCANEDGGERSKATPSRGPIPVETTTAHPDRKPATGSAVPNLAAPASEQHHPPSGNGVKVSADQIRRDYQSNEVTADDRYRGKIIDVTGIVKAVKKSVLGDPYVALSTSNMFESTDARFSAEDATVLRSFLRGDKVILRCVGNGVALGSPQIEDCVLLRHYRRAPAPASD